MPAPSRPLPDYSYNVLPNTQEDRTFRCKVEGNAKAILIANRKVIKVQVRETSGGGYTIGIKPKYTKKLQCGKFYELRYQDRRVKVVMQRIVDNVDGESRLYLGTIKEYEPKESWGFRLPFMGGNRISAHDSAVNSTAAYGGFVMVLFAVLALPGLGERLGTADRIQSAFDLMTRNMSEVYHQVAN